MGYDLVTLAANQSFQIFLSIYLEMSSRYLRIINALCGYHKFSSGMSQLFDCGNKATIVGTRYSLQLNYHRKSKDSILLLTIPAQTFTFCGNCPMPSLYNLNLIRKLTHQKKINFSLEEDSHYICSLIFDRISWCSFEFR